MQSIYANNCNDHGYIRGQAKFVLWTKPFIDRNEQSNPHEAINVGIVKIREMTHSKISNNLRHEQHDYTDDDEPLLVDEEKSEDENCKILTNYI